MAAAGDVVFSRDMDDNKSDIWDDTALIKAYDDAVNSMKAQISSHLGEDHENKSNKVGGQSKKKHKKNRKKQKKKERSNDQHSIGSATLWQVGDHCRAVYTEDGQIYEAVIISTEQDEETCRVRYLGYGNEEDHALDDLLQSKEHVTAGGARGAHSESDSMEWTHPGIGSRGCHHPAGRHGNIPQGMGRGWTPPPPPRLPSPLGPHMGDMLPPMMPPMFPPMMPGMGMPPFGSMSSPIPGPMGIPDIPPPPSPDDLEGDKEALHNMLISWYMSGYHTGYYQGLKHSKKSPTKSNEATEPKQKSENR